MESKNELLKLIAKAIYWNEFNHKEEKHINEILGSDYGNEGKANLICECLYIPKRGNRSAIIEVLRTNN